MNIKRILQLMSLLTMLLLVTGCQTAPVGTNGSGTTTPGGGNTISIPVTCTPTPLPYHKAQETDLKAKAFSFVPTTADHLQTIWESAEAETIETVISGESEMTAEFKAIWEEKFLNVLVHVMNDATPDTDADTFWRRDGIILYINEDGRRNKNLSVGDAYYLIDRNGKVDYGFGASKDIQTSAFSDGTESGYYIVAKVPLMQNVGHLDMQIGFDVRVNNAEEQKCIHAIQWKSDNKNCEKDFRKIGLLTFDTMIRKSEDSKMVYRRIPIRIDGKRDDTWDMCTSYTLLNRVYGNKGVSGSFKASYDDRHLYLYVKVEDRTPFTDGDLNTRKDGVEIFLNESGSKAETYGDGDQHYMFLRNGQCVCGNGADESFVQYLVTETETGYVLEACFDWGLQTHDGSIGFDIRINDSQSSGTRDSILQWSDTGMNTHKCLTGIGTLFLD